MKITKAEAIVLYNLLRSLLAVDGICFSHPNAAALERIMAGLKAALKGEK